MSVTFGSAGWAAHAIQQALSHEAAHAPDAEHLQHEAPHAEAEQPLSEMSPAQLQKVMEQLLKQSEVISNTLKKAGEASDAILRNMK